MKAVKLQKSRTGAVLLGEVGVLAQWLRQTTVSGYRSLESLEMIQSFCSI